MKQTAVEWLLENLNSEPYSEEDFKYNRDCWDKALEMEKEQKIAFGKKCYHPLTERKHTSDVHFECTICGDNNY
jgi:hypothetical protein